MRIGFIFSLPRSGSTYVQRVLSGAPDVATVPEPWLLPALFGIRVGDPPVADFAFDHVRIGLNDTLDRLDDGEAAWDRAVAGMAQSLYSNFADASQIFIDKTPRNAPFASDIMRAFPEAPMLFLWRNPLAVAASINRTWGNGKWKTYFYHYDLYHGLRKLVEEAKASGAQDRVKCVRYEDLVGRPDEMWPEIFSHFGATYSPGSVANPPKMLSRMGDVTGQNKYVKTRDNSVDNWQSGYGNRVRKKWAKNYLNDIGDEALSFMGYNRQEILSQLDRCGDAHWSDHVFIRLAPLYHFIEPHGIKGKLGRDGKSAFARR